MITWPSSQIKTKGDKNANDLFHFQVRCLKMEEIKLFWFLSLEQVTVPVASEADDVLYKTEKKENWRSATKTVTHVEKATG